MNSQPGPEDFKDQLFAASIVGQLEFDYQEAIHELRLVGETLKRAGAVTTAMTLGDRLLLGITGIAVLEYRDGALWDSVFQSMPALADTQANRQKIADAFRESLDRFELERFVHPWGNLGEMLMQSAIPHSSIPGFVSILGSYYESSDSPAGLDFCDWIRSWPLEIVNAKGLSKPVWRFIQQAGEIADDLVEKCIEIFADLQDGEYDENGGEGLPAALIEAIVQEIKSKSIRRKASGTRIPQPKLFWETDESSAIQLELPSVEIQTNSAVMWKLEVGDKELDQQVLPPPPGLSPVRSYIEIKSPVKSLNPSVNYLEAEELVTRAWSIQIAQDEFPILFFDANGYFVPGRGPISPGLYRCVYPAALKEGSLVLSTESDFQFERLPAPLGWSDSKDSGTWNAIKVDLRKTKKIEFLAGFKKIQRTVSNLKKPYADLEGKLQPGLRTRMNSKVISGLPRFEIIGNESSSVEESWRYQVFSQSGVVLLDSQLPQTGNFVNPPVTSEDISGEVRVRLSGGFGKTAEVQVGLFPGLQSEEVAGARRLRAQGGLEEFEMSISIAGAVQKLRFGPYETSKILEVQKNELIASPEHESLTLLNTSSRNSSEWIEPAKFHIEDIDNLQLRINLSTDTNGRLIAIWPKKDPVLVNPLSESKQEIYNLSQLGYDAQVGGSFQLFWLLQDNTRKLVGNGYPKQLVESVEFNEESKTITQTFRGNSEPEGLLAAFFSDYAPWLGPVVTNLMGEPLNVPDEILEFGDFSIEFALSNPWSPHKFDQFPDRKSLNFHPVEVCIPDPNASPEHAFAYFIQSGIETELASLVDSKILWIAVAENYVRSSSPSSRDQIRLFAERMLRERGSESLAFFEGTSKEEKHYMKFMFATEALIKESIEVTEGRLLSNVGRPFLATLLSKNHEQLTNEMALGSWGLQESRPQTSEDSTEEEIDTKSLESWVSEALIRRVKVFGKLETVFLAKWEPEEWEAHREKLELFPGPLLSTSRLFDSAEKIFAADLEERQFLMPDELQSAVNELQKHDSEFPSPLSDLRGPLSEDHLGDLQGFNRFLVHTPWISMKLAELARLAARDNQEALEAWRAFEKIHKKLSTFVPDLVEGDLVLAELNMRTGGFA